MKCNDLTGQRFGMLLVQTRAENSVLGKARWNCVCDCGKESIAVGVNLRNGHTISCGCFRSIATKMNETRHGHTVGRTTTPTYRSWVNMIQRCTNPKVKAHMYYGERGISYCERWSQFDNFLADMGECPAGMSIDRINNDGNYEPSNCRWATKEEQASNKRNNRFVEHDGKRMTIAQWSRHLGIHAGTLLGRVYRTGGLTTVRGKACV